MKAFVRVLFFLLIMLGMASQSIRASRGFAERDSVPILIQRLSGLNFRTTRLGNSDILVGRTRLCAQPILVTPLTTSGAEDEVTRDLS